MLWKVGPSQIRYVCYYDYLLDHLNQPRDVIGLTAIELMVGIAKGSHPDHR